MLVIAVYFKCANIQSQFISLKINRLIDTSTELNVYADFKKRFVLIKKTRFESFLILINQKVASFRKKKITKLLRLRAIPILVC